VELAAVGTTVALPFLRMPGRQPAMVRALSQMRGVPVSYERMVVYALDCDRRPCAGGTKNGAYPYSEDFGPGCDGLRGARAEARERGWARDGKLDICPADVKEEGLQ
jgi:hypothetical protein